MNRLSSLIFHLVALVLVYGGSTTLAVSKKNPSTTEQHRDFAVQIIEARIKGADQANLHAELFWDARKEMLEGAEGSSRDLLSPDSPDPNDEVKKPRAVYLPRPNIAQETVDKIRNLPNAEVYEHPVFYASPGEQAISDQTVSKVFVKDCKVVDGQTVQTMETVKLGHYAELLITQAEGSTVNCNLKLASRKLVGTDVYALENGDQVEKPIFSSAEISTETSLSTNEWTLFSASVNAQSVNTTATKSSRFYFIRVIPKQ